MKTFRSLVAKVLVIAMLLSLMPVMGANKEVVAAENFSVIAPANGAVVAAGYIDIKWTPATGGTVKDYAIYVNGEKVATTTSTSYELYTTKVQYNSVTVQAEYTNGTSKNAQAIKFGVTKKGLGLASDMGAKVDLKGMGLGWYYNWGTSPSNGSQYSGVEYVPMIWRETNANNAASRINDFVSKGYKYCLTFNEPDLGDQCNMSVNDVFNVYKGCMNNNIKVSSPVTALWPQASSNWFQPFMEKIDANGDMDVDFISIHCYPDNYAGAGMANWFLESVVDWTWNKYHKPIWITEFSTSGQYVTAEGGNGTKEFWENVMPGLDARAYVERYAAFGFNSDSCGLWKYADGSLTPAGKVYKAKGNPVDDGKVYNIPEKTPQQTTTQAPTTTTQKQTTTTQKQTTTTQKQTTTQKATTTQPQTTISKPSVNGDNYTYTQLTRNTLLDDTANIDGVIYKDYIAQGGVTAKSSSDINGGNTAAKAIDSDFGSRWESVHGVDPQWLTLDLGKAQTIKQLGIIWETASAKNYRVQVSNDGANFTDVADITCDKSTNNRFDSIMFKNPVAGRYVRIYGVSRTTGYGYSIFDMAVYGGSNSGQTQTTTAQPTTTQPITTPSVPSTENIAKGKKAVSSGNEGNNVAANYAVDGNDGTRWSSNFSDDAWMYVDLGSTYNVNKVVLKWEAAYGKAFDIQVSNDGNAWTTVKSVTDSKGGTNTIEFNQTSARYVKMQGVKRATGYGYSLWEMQVFAGSSSSGGNNGSSNNSGNNGSSNNSGSDNNGGVIGNVATGVNVALNKTATQSGAEGNGTAAKYAIDGNAGTRWSSNFADDAWMVVDLGKSYSINKVKITWEAAYGKDYNILVSNDGVNFINVKTVVGSDGGTDTIEFNTTTARYVKMQGVKRATGYGYSIWEMEVIGA